MEIINHWMIKKMMTRQVRHSLKPLVLGTINILSMKFNKLLRLKNYHRGDYNIVNLISKIKTSQFSLQADQILGYFPQEHPND